jgi:hypothetical protein
MAQGSRRSDDGGRRFEAGTVELDCPTAWEHEVEIPGPGRSGSVTVIALRCPNCDPRSTSSVTDELSEIVASRRRTMAGLRRLPARTRADLTALGTLDQIYLGTVDDVRAAAERCRRRLGMDAADLPADLSGTPTPAPGREQAAAVLAAATAWVTELSTSPS